MYRIHSGTPFGRPLRYRIEAMKMNAGRKKITTQLMNRVVIAFFRMTRWIHYGMLLIRCFLRSHSENISTTVTIPTIPHNKAPAAAHS